MSSYAIERQKIIVATTMCVHNFIHDNHYDNKDFRQYDQNPGYVPTIPLSYKKNFPSHHAADTSTSESRDRDMGKVLHGQFFFLDHHKHMCLYYNMICVV